ncbi:MAG: hypothetical protein QHH07_03035 [Sedimentisphaerales bacterium]|nr:hypothetical protein [Sedimentisphaerales bacterium]
MSRKTRFIWLGLAGLITITCFVVLAILPPSKAGYLKDPLRGILAGLAVAGVGLPLCVAGSTIEARFGQSPYFEGRFIAGFLSLLGYIFLCLALVCIGFGLYALVTRYTKG